MYKESLKLVFRKFVRNKVYLMINIIGLTIALTAALLIYSHVVKEWNTDRFHTHGKEIYRVLLKYSGAQKWESWTSGPTAPYTKAEFPEIREYVRVTHPRAYAFKGGKNEEFTGAVQCVYADCQFFKVFTFPLVSGEVGEHPDPDWVVVSERVAKQYFAGRNPVGETIVLKDPDHEDDKGKEYRVTAVMKDIPASSTLQTDMVVDFSYQDKTVFKSWGMHGVYTYFQLTGNADIAKIEHAIPEIIEKNYQWITADEHKVKLQPLRDIYFNSDDIMERVPHGSTRLNVSLCGITLLILVLAFGNYVMIQMAQFHRNATGLAIQRCFGANNRQLYGMQFWETVVHVVLALLFTVLLTWFLHPFFVQVISPKLIYTLHFSFWEVVVFLVLLIVGTVSVSAVLSFYMLRHMNRNSIREVIQTSVGKLDVRKILSVAQMCIFCALLFCSFILVRQMNFVRDRKLGFDNRNVIHMTWVDRNLNIESLFSALMRNPDILSMSNGDGLPVLGEEPVDVMSAENPEVVTKAYAIHGDSRFLDTYQIHLAEGRGIRPESYPARLEDFYKYRPDRVPEIVVNKKLAEQLKLEQPVGTLLKESRNRKIVFRVVGVVEDFHFLPLYEAVQPMYIIYDLPMISYSFIVRYREGKRSEVLAWLEKSYRERFTNSNFSYREYDYSQLYEKDLALAKLIQVFTLIAILISGMGIFAFAMFMAESKTREIALRKVNGAQEWEIVSLLNRGFIMRILLACAIGLPVAHMAMVRWLEGFAYKAELSWWIYVMVVVVSALLVLLIITWQVWRVATVNPVEGLKGERKD